MYRLASDGECVDARCPTDSVATPINNTPVSARPTIIGPHTVWFFNGQTPSGYATQITLSTQSNQISPIKGLPYPQRWR